MRPGRHLGYALAALTAVLLFVGLGLWQLGRGLEKEITLARSAEVLGQRQILRLDAVANESSRELVWVEGAGHFDERGPLLLDNQIRAGRAGVRVFRIFVAEGRALPMLVDLGWLPLPPNRDLPTIPKPPGRWLLRGLLAPPPSTGIGLGSGIVPAGPGWLLTRVDLPEIASATGLSVALTPRVLRLDPALPIGFERDLDVLPNTLPPERHFGYAAQWFGLAATVLVVYLVLTWRSFRSHSLRPQDKS